MSNRVALRRSPLVTCLALCALSFAVTSACGEAKKDDAAKDDSAASETDPQDTSDDPTTTPTTSGAPSASETPNPAGGAMAGGMGGADTEELCNEAGQACCAGDVCNFWRLVCVDGTCQDCGKDVGQKCCTAPDHAPCGSTPDGEQLGCGNGETCELCGEPGQACCLDTNEDGPEDDEYDVCGSTTDHVCDLTTHTCLDCGAAGGLCCEYGKCNDSGECMGIVEGEANGTCPG